MMLLVVVSEADFRGKPRRLIDSMLSTAEIPNATFTGASNVPGSTSLDDLTENRGRLLRQVREASTVLVLGSVALSCWRSDVPLHRTVGLWLGRPALSTYHPAFVLRGAQVGGDIYETVEMAKKIHDGAAHWKDFRAETCTRCVAPVAEWDRDGIGYCFMHWGKCEDQWGKDLKKWLKRENQRLQGRLW